MASAAGKAPVRQAGSIPNSPRRSPTRPCSRRHQPRAARNRVFPGSGVPPSTPAHPGASGASIGAGYDRSRSRHAFSSGCAALRAEADWRPADRNPAVCAKKFAALAPGETRSCGRVIKQRDDPGPDKRRPSLRAAATRWPDGVGHCIGVPDVVGTGICRRPVRHCDHREKRRGREEGGGGGGRSPILPGCLPACPLASLASFACTAPISSMTLLLKAVFVCYAPKLAIHAPSSTLVNGRRFVALVRTRPSHHVETTACYSCCASPTLVDSLLRLLGAWDEASRSSRRGKAELNAQLTDAFGKELPAPISPRSSCAST